MSQRSLRSLASSQRAPRVPPVPRQQGRVRNAPNTVTLLRGLPLPPHLHVTGPKNQKPMASPTTARSRLCFNRVVVRFFRSSSWHTRCRFQATDSSARAYSVAPHPRADRRSRGARHVDARGHARACVPRPRRAARAPARSRRASASRLSSAISGRLRGRRAARRASPVDTGGSIPRDRRGWFHRVAPVRAAALQRRRGRRRGQPRRARPLPRALQEANLEVLRACRGGRRRLRRVARFVRADVSDATAARACSVGGWTNVLRTQTRDPSNPSPASATSARGPASRRFRRRRRRRERQRRLHRRAARRRRRVRRRRVRARFVRVRVRRRRAGSSRGPSASRETDRRTTRSPRTPPPSAPPSSCARRSARAARRFGGSRRVASSPRTESAAGRTWPCSASCAPACAARPFFGSGTASPPGATTRTSRTWRSVCSRRCTARRLRRALRGGERRSGVPTRLGA